MDSKETLEYISLQKTVKKIDLNSLPDGGKRIMERIRELEKKKNKQFDLSGSINDVEDVEENDSEGNGDVSVDDKKISIKNKNDYRRAKAIISDEEDEDDEDDDDDEDEDEESERTESEEESGEDIEENVINNKNNRKVDDSENDESEQSSKNENIVVIETDDESDKKLKSKDDTSIKSISENLVDDSLVLDTDKLNSLNDKNDSQVFDKLKHLGLNDTYENKASKSLVNTVIDDSIECLNDSPLPTQVNQFKTANLFIDETPEADSLKPIKLYHPKVAELKRIDSSSSPSDSKTKQIKPSNIVVEDTPEGDVVDSPSPQKYSENQRYLTSQINDSIGEINYKTKKENESPNNDIVEILDSPVADRKAFAIKNSPSLRRYDADQRQIPSWSPNFEQIKAKVSKNIQEPRKIKMLDETTLKNEPEAKDKASNYNFDYFGDSIANSTQRFRNRNLAYEDELKKLSEKMLQILETKPDPDNFEAKSPKSLKVKLLDHQYYAMAWLKWREATIPRGGILADDMGLGKTLTILSYLQLVKEQREEQLRREEEDEEDKENEDDEDYNLDDDEDNIRRPRKLKTNLKKPKKAKRLRTLIIVPASLLHQWKGEIENRFEKNSFKYHAYHDANRKKHAYNLEDNDIVFTTYEIVTRELETLGDAKEEEDIQECLRRSNSPLARIKWKRIILDEAHRIKNHTTKANKTICALNAKYRITMTGTPVHNSLNDLYSLVKFLHLEPLNDHKVWKYLFGSEKAAPITKTSTNTKNAETRDARYNSWLLILSDMLILRRTKSDKVNVNGEMKSLVALPDKSLDIIRIKLNKNEKFIYDKIFGESLEKVKKFLINQQKKLIGVSNGGSFSEILVYLLRLRQACSHVSLLSECLDINELQRLKSETEDVETLMQNMSLNSNSSDKSINDLNVLNELNDNDELETCVGKNYLSAKLVKLLEMVENVMENSHDDKVIIVSQWTSLLNIIGYHLKQRSYEFYEIRGDVNLIKRNEIVEVFNKANKLDVRIMLLSLNAGGVGLNLVGANYMFLLDIHWNPALEQQACDRIYRVGQKKNVNIYRFICENTIEERIEQIQQFKIDIANRVCNAGSSAPSSLTSRNTKLTLQDIKLLFQGFDNNTNNTSKV